MTRDEALRTWSRCMQVCERKGSFFSEENDGSLARKLMAFPDAVIEQVKLADDAMWPNSYAVVLKVTHVPEVPAVPPRPPLPGRAAVPAKFFYLAVG